MSKSMCARAATVLTAVGLILCGFAEAPAQGARTASPDRLAAIQEMQQIQQRLAGLADQAFERNPELQQEVDRIDEFVGRVMQEIEPSAEQDIVRLRALETELQTARDAQDTPRMQALLSEGARLVERLEETRATALARPDVAARIQAFQARLMETMTGIDPEAPRLLQRLEQIAARFH